MLAPEIVHSVNALLGDQVEPLSARQGGNARVVFLAGTEGAAYALKLYPRGASSEIRAKRDRLNTEVIALSFLRENGFEDVPRPLAASPGLGYAVFEQVMGQPAVEQPEPDDALAMAEFFQRLAALSNLPVSRVLPNASDACFCLTDARDQAERRLARLAQTPDQGKERKAMHRFLKRDLGPTLEDVFTRAAAFLTAHGIDPEAPLPMPLRVLSPSDFGPHNAIRTPLGRLVFCDFEYFGLDDPAKLAADVLLHPGSGLSPADRRRFVAALCRARPQDASLDLRLKAYVPLLSLIWACIALNPFAGPEDKTSALTLAARLATAKSMRARAKTATRDMSKDQ